MGKNDVRISGWLSEKERFADLYNPALFHGKPIFTADTLEKMDTRQNLSFQSNNGKEVLVQRFHDICMKSTLGAKLILLTCENQDEIHYAMPVRGMLYDALDYTDQIRQISQGNKKKKNYHNSAEFLSGFTKNDKLVPVISLVFYYGDEEWDGSLDIHSLLDLSNEEKDTFGKYLPNYKINLVDAKKLAKENCLNSDL
ncbi:MAG: Rpn family recombination-promoting nuclease/putative transposase [Faecalimonas sp.]|nr:Rpn family recombination-promoting nuclease/putative transposase [Faecalimonas sp.]